MSYNFDGKIANQCPSAVNLNTAKTLCAKCKKLIDFPKRLTVEIDSNTYFVYSYLNTAHSIYETKSGKAVVYCSDYCKRKHNHRFAR
jgi:hypothetical protein